MIQAILESAERLVRTCGCRDPFEAAQLLHINVWERDLGGMKGFYNIFNRERYIVLNQNLSPEEKKIVCAHELGHDRLHRHFAQFTPLSDFYLYDMARKPEREANIFGAAFLIADDDIRDHAGYTTEQIAQILHTSENYVKLKIELLEHAKRSLL